MKRCMGRAGGSGTTSQRKRCTLRAESAAPIWARRSPMPTICRTTRRMRKPVRRSVLSFLRGECWKSRRRQGMQTLWNAHFIMAYSAAWRWMERAFSMSIRWRYCRRHVIRMNENFMSSRFARNGSAAHAARQTWRVCSARSVPMHIRKTRIRCFYIFIWEAPWKRRSAKRQQISVWNPTSLGRGM